ncbi:ATPase [Patescibacteria group bacterium]|nr:MAG: ATPase [Patescibacteria group bacterium]
MATGVTIVKASGERELFDRTKLDGSLLRAGADKETISEIAGHVEKELKDGMSTSQIYKHAFFLLEKHQKPAAVRYSLRRAVMELGPSGFPFEDFVAYILKEKGYEVKTGETVLGGCVAHEIDIVAWNENKLIMAEAKFHNEPGIKSDLKITLYVKARVDDLKEVKHNYGRVRDLDEGWLITNTKFTTTAIHYGECKGLTLIGWNYPKEGNLQDLIEDSGLHPVTCLTSLSGAQKKSLMSQGVVLCRSLKEHPDVLHSIGFNDQKTKEVLDEIAQL